MLSAAAGTSYGTALARLSAADLPERLAARGGQRVREQPEAGVGFAGNPRRTGEADQPSQHGLDGCRVRDGGDGAPRTIMRGGLTGISGGCPSAWLDGYSASGRRGDIMDLDRRVVARITEITMA